MLKTTEKLVFYYENMVNWDERLEKEGPFIIHKLKQTGAKTVLDCGCGTGRHTIYLRKHGFFADGLDLNPLHIKTAEKHANEEKLQIKFIQGDITKPENMVPGDYDAFIILGNTLAYLAPTEASGTLNTLSGLLNPGGMILGHVLNYSSFEHKDRTETRWTTIEGGRVVFLKTFHFEENHVAMILNSLEEKGEEWITTIDTTIIHYLDRNFFNRALTDAGFVNIEFFGSLTGERFDLHKSRDLVFSAVKR